MSEGSTFPIFIRPELQDGSPAFAEFQRLASTASKQAAESFKSDFREVTSVISNALSKGLSGGKLNFDVSQLKQAQAEARLFGEALNGTLRTAQLLATETGDTSAETRQYILALEAASKAQDENRRGIDAQIATYTRLQAAMDVTADKNSKLAQAYRETFAEAARLARIEVNNRALGATIAPAMGAKATDSGAGYSALAELQQKLIRQEELFAQIAKRNQQQVAAAVEFNRSATERYATALAQLKQQIDPVAAAEARLASEIEFATLAFRRGDISAEQYAIRLNQLKNANTLLAGSQRQLRQATVQAGQQLQDIFISIAGGQRISTVLAQQLPQLAYAFQGVGGKVGAAASVISGPWGLAVVGAGLLLGGLIDQLIGAEDATEKSKKANETFTEQLDREKHSLGEVTTALNEYYRTKERGREIDIDNSRLAAQRVADNIRETIAIREKIAALLEELNTRAFMIGQGGQFEIPGQTAILQGSLRAQLDDNAKKLQELSGHARSAVIDVAEQVAKIQSDTVVKLQTGFSEMRKEARASIKDAASLSKRLTEINKQEAAAIEAARKSERGSKSTALPPVTLREVTDLITSQLGGRITSTTGGKHVKGSYHYSGQAVDFVPKGGMGALSKADIREAFGAAGIQIKELLGPGDKGHDDHFHAAFAKRRQSVEQVNDAIKRAEDAAKRAADQLQNGIDRAADSVERLRGRFDEAPRDIDVATAAITDLNRAIDEADAKLKAGGLTDAQKAVIQQTRDTALQTRDQLIPAFLKRPVEDRITSGERELQLQRLVLAGREDEADVLSLQFDVMRQLRVENEADLRTELEKRGITFERYQILLQQREEMIAMSRAQDRLDRAVLSTQSKLRELDRAYETIAQGVAGLPDDVLGSIKDIAGNLRKQVNEIIARRITDSLFGNLFARLEGEIRGKRPIDMATGNYVDSTVRASGALNQLTDSFLYASSIMRGTAANDNIASKLLNSGKMVDGIPTAGRLFGKAAGASYNPTDIVVTGERHTSEVVDQLKRLNKVTREGLGTDSPLTKKLGGFLKNAAEGAFIGQTASSLVFGNKGSAAGSAIGGALGKIAGEAIGKTLGGLGGKIAGPLGSIAGGLIGSALGSAIMGTKKGTATIGGSGGDLAIASYGGNSKKFQQAAGTGADSAISTINRIAEMLGANVNASAGSVSIGIRDGKYRVDTSGKGITKTKKGAIDFGEDAEAAIRAATMDLIKDGVLTGLKASTQRILQQGKDLDAAVQKALDFESVFSRLKEFNDPVGAALDALNKEFTRLKKIFAEAGASTSEYADLEKLYGIEREKAIKEAAERVTSSLQSLYDNLTIGDNGRSLRDRLAAAQSAYDPLKARVLAGDKTAYDDFANAAQALLEIQRQFSGSQTPYFNLLDEITKITKDRIDFEKNIVSISEGRDSPFTSTGASNDNYAPVVSAIGEMNQTLINGFRALLLAGGGGGERGFYTNAFL